MSSIKKDTSNYENQENSTYKLYLFYLKSEKNLYAYTINKEYKKKFLDERNKDKFIVRKIDIDKYDFMVFQDKYHNKKLEEIPLNNNEKDYVIIIGTEDEDTKLTEKLYEIEHIIEDSYRTLIMQGNFKKKYTEAIEYLCSTTYMYKNKDNTKDLYSRFNLLYTFITLFRDTF